MRTEEVFLPAVKCFEMWWPGTELNRRRQPFQGCALPPELPGHISRPLIVSFGRKERLCVWDADWQSHYSEEWNAVDYSNHPRFPQCVRLLSEASTATIAHGESRSFSEKGRSQRERVVCGQFRGLLCCSSIWIRTCDPDAGTV
jgi:hypothetical protein